MEIKKKEVRIPQMYRPDSAPREHKSTRRGLMERLGLAFLACALAIGVIGSASAGPAGDEAAVRALGDRFANAFIQKNADARASLFAENGTFVTPQGDFLARPGRNGEGLRFGGGRGQRLHASGVLQLPSSLHQTRYRSRGRAPHLAQCQRSGWNDHPRDPGQLLLRWRRAMAINGRSKTGRAHFAPAPANSMTSHN